MNRIGFALVALLFLVGTPAFANDDYQPLLASNGQSLNPTTVSGQCAFGAKTYRIRIIDGNGNAFAGDPFTVQAGLGQAMAITSGDTLIVETGNASGPKTVRAFYGQPVRVNGAWYTVAKNGNGFIAHSLKCAMGSVTIPHDRWSAVFAGAKNLLYVTGGAKPISLPADHYTVMDYQEYTQPDASGRSASFTLYNAPSSGYFRAQGKSAVISAGKNAKLNLGSPLSIKVNVQQVQQNMMFSFTLTDITGQRVNVAMPGNRVPPPPQASVTDANGKVVHSFAFEYG